MEKLFDFLLEGKLKRGACVYLIYTCIRKFTSFLPQSISKTFFQQPLLQYLIFPAQFAFLYSYYPSGNMEKLPAQLEEIWQAKHFEDAEKAFAAVEGGQKIESGPSFFKTAEVEEKVSA